MSLTIPVLSLWQPWASLIFTPDPQDPAHFLKEYETRSWETPFRGLMAIHAAQKKIRPADFGMAFEFQLVADKINPQRLPYGKVIGFVNLTACLHSEDAKTVVRKKDLVYGNYDAGRYAFRLQDPKKLDVPLPMTGRQGFFNWTVPDELIERYLQ